MHAGGEGEEVRERLWIGSLYICTEECVRGGRTLTDNKVRSHTVFCRLNFNFFILTVIWSYSSCSEEYFVE